MRHVFWLWFVAGFLTVGLSAQAPQNPALAGAATAPIPDTNPFTTESDVRAGEALFQTHCSYCHGSFGEGGRGADLTAGVYRHGGRDPELYASVRNGIPGTEMAPVRVSDDDVWRMIAFVRRLGPSRTSRSRIARCRLF
jgi:mono/diheme cytochrome c family protein